MGNNAVVSKNAFWQQFKPVLKEVFHHLGYNTNVCQDVWTRPNNKYASGLLLRTPTPILAHSSVVTTQTAGTSKQPQQQPSASNTTSLSVLLPLVVSSAAVSSKQKHGESAFPSKQSSAMNWADIAPAAVTTLQQHGESAIPSKQSSAVNWADIAPAAITTIQQPGEAFPANVVSAVKWADIVVDGGIFFNIQIIIVLQPLCVASENLHIEYVDKDQHGLLMISGNLCASVVPPLSSLFVHLPILFAGTDKASVMPPATLLNKIFKDENGYSDATSSNVTTSFGLLTSVKVRKRASGCTWLKRTMHDFGYVISYEVPPTASKNIKVGISSYCGTLHLGHNSNLSKKETDMQRIINARNKTLNAKWSMHLDQVYTLPALISFIQFISLMLNAF